MSVKIGNSEVEEALRSILNNTLKEIMSVVNADCGSLFLFDSDNKELVLNSFFNSNQLRLQGLRRKIGEGVAGKVAEIKTPILVRDIGKDARFKHNGFKHYRTNSFISIPLFTPKGLLGLINLADKSTGEPFSEKDLEFAVTVWKYVSMIIYSINGKKEEKASDDQKIVLEKYASVGKLAAGIVHEINNPLDGIMRYTNMLIDQMDSNSVAREYLLEMKKGLSRIGNITKSLLAFSNQVNSQQVTNYVDLHSVIDESLSTLNGKLNCNIQVNKIYKDGLPKVLDFGLTHVVTNLIKNAIDAMPCGGTLDISTDLKDSGIKISFKDTGLGIPCEIRSRIFEPFFTTKNIDKGTGLGLAISSEIMSKYEGKIDVQSSPGKGSTFTVLIPAKHLKNA